MAIKQRALLKLNTTKHHILRAMSAGGAVALGEACRGLTEIRDLYREGLPRQSYAAYGEIYDGLILAIRKMMEGGEADTQGDALALCKELLEHIETETEKEKNFKKEVFFLPYKASMWDSLESVWKAAHEDKEHCNAYVMPIPYADLNPDRSVAAWHCERDQFPKYVPILDWQEIDLKAWHPDAIFYHNPYDDCNLVTSVESRYYSRNLKECADKLVYVPYYVTEEPYSVCEAEENTRAGCILTPGVVNADIVVVQSEPVRQIYINVMLKGTSQKDRSYWEQKILALGSPKFDKVLTSKKEDFELPEKWRKLVEGKKVILYNTSLSAMLQNTDKVCDKLRYVFEVFRNREDVILWWRPHPLMKSTFISMRPEYAEEYCNLEKKYIEEGWGIYDDSPDLHRAICWSDAYYGDSSSVVDLYRITSKGLMIEDIGDSEDNVNIFDFKKIRYIFPEKNHIWFVSADTYFCILYKWELDTNRLECLEHLPLGERFLQTHLIIGKIKDIIVIAPFFSDKEFIEYDVSTGCFRRVRMQKEISRSGNRAAFTDAVVYKNSIFFMGLDSGVIVEYNSISHDYAFHDIKHKGVGVERHSWVKVQNCVYAVVYDTNKMVQLDLDSFELEMYEIPCETKFKNMSYDGEDFFLLSIDGNSMVRWNKGKTACSVILLFAEEKDFVEDRYYNSIPYGNGVILLPYKGKKALFFDKLKSEVYTIKQLGENRIMLDDNGREQFSLVVNDEENSFAFDEHSSRMYVFSNKRNVIKSYVPSFDKNQEKQIMLKLITQRNVNMLAENHPLSLFEFMDCDFTQGTGKTKIKSVNSKAIYRMVYS